jgi:predicted PurR-regulated permease PerM
MRSISIYRLNATLLLLILTTIVLYYGKDFLVPLFFSILFSMLLLPVCNWLEKKGIGRIWSTLIGILIILLFISGIVGIIVGQGASLAEDLPGMQQKAQEFLQTAQEWIQNKYGMAPQKQMEYAKKGIDGLSQSGGTFFKDIFSWVLGLLSSLVLVLLYFFFIMWKREKYKEFFLKLVKEENRAKVSGELKKISYVSGRYLIGRLISMGFLAIIYMIGFTIVGLPNGLLLALVAVLPTIVPYIGAFVGGFFPLAIALIGGTPDLVLPVAVILIVAQVIDNNIIEPLVEGEAMDISPIFTIIAIVLGELVWGVAGMILFIPMFAILKIICDHILQLHPYSYLLTNDVDEPKWVNSIKEWFKKKKSSSK